jgi:hypothetical protein
MRYTVVSTDRVPDELAEIWLQAADRSAISQAASENERILRLTPLAPGMDHGSFRTLTVGPFTVLC